MANRDSYDVAYLFDVILISLSYFLFLERNGGTRKIHHLTHRNFRN